jgi:hypothetical protein
MKRDKLTEFLQNAIRDSGSSLYTLAMQADMDDTQLSRFMRNERTLTIPVAAKLCALMGLELRQTQKTSSTKGKSVHHDREYNFYAFQWNDGCDDGLLRYNKRQFVLAILKDFCKRNPNCILSIGEMRRAFPESLHPSGGLFRKIDEAREIYDRTGTKRHFIDAEESFEFKDGSVYVVTNQWGTKRHPAFREQCRQLGYKIWEYDSAR